MTLYLAALAAFALGGLLALAAARRPRLSFDLASLGAVLGCALGLAAVLPVLARGGHASLRLAWQVPYGAIALDLDPLSALFQAVLFGLGLPAAVYGWSDLRAEAGRRSLPAFGFFFDLLLASISLVLAAGQAVLFLVAWELMTVASFAVVTFDHQEAEVRRAGFVYLVASHLGTAFVVALLVLLGREAGGLDFAAFAALRRAPAVPTSLLLALGLVGFGTKAGFAPLHVWLPEAHPAAPSHASALLSGAMIKAGLYGLLRLLTFLPPAPEGFGWTLAAVGVLGGLGAIALSLGQSDLKRALAYSSVENMGIVALGLGLALVAGARGAAAAALLGLSGALLHVWNHAVMKGLAFMGAGALAHAAHTRDLERMGGLLRRLPATGALFAVGAAALAALPPLAGFSSEWLVYLGLLSGAGSAAGAVALLGYLGVAALAAVGAIAAVSFTRLAGAALLGAPRSEGAARAREPGPAAVAPLAVLAAGCLALGVLPGAALRLLAPAVAQLSRARPEAVAAALAPAVSALEGPLRAVLAALVGLGAAAALGRRALLARRRAAADTWGCGLDRPTARMEYTASSYAQLLLSGPVPRGLRPRDRAEVPRGVFPRRASLATESRDPARARLFDPAFRLLADRMSRLRQMQSGRLNLQLFYTVVTVLALAAALVVRDLVP